MFSPKYLFLSHRSPSTLSVSDPGSFHLVTAILGILDRKLDHRKGTKILTSLFGSDTLDLCLYSSGES